MTDGATMPNLAEPVDGPLLEQLEIRVGPGPTIRGVSSRARRVLGRFPLDLA
jgi:hypothetical protein